MENIYKSTIREFQAKQLFFLIATDYIIINFLISLGSSSIASIMDNIFLCVALLGFIVFATFTLWLLISCHLKKNNLPQIYSLIVLSPITLLLFYASDSQFPLLIPILIVSLTMICFFLVLIKKNIIMPEPKIGILIAAILYFLVFAYLAIRQYNNFAVFNPQDYSNYNQIFWNTIRGNIFRSSLYGSNFTCHNSPFYFLLVPFYSIFPLPLTLMILKTLLLSLCVIPIYLIAKPMLPKTSLLPISLIFLFYPYLVSQNLNPPHEICYAPFFLLFTYYFFKTKRFYPFIIALILSISIKEHIALVAIMFGVFALFRKRGPKWFITPIILGVAWAIFSLILIDRFKEMYQMKDTSTWLLLNMKQRFLYQGEGNIVSFISNGLAQSNICKIYSLKIASLLLLPLGMLLPLLSPVGLLGLPELILNLLADSPAVFSPSRHYNIIVSCFLIIATIESIQKISSFSMAKKLRIKTEKFTLIIVIFIFSLTLIHAYSWLWLTSCPNSYIYVSTMKEAISIIPKKAHVMIPSNIAVHVSSRKKYSIIGVQRYSNAKEDPIADYVLIDKNTIYIKAYLKDIYSSIFNKNGIEILKKDIGENNSRM
ncbi:DUF2079 domain-containing protein [Thermoproteota archaeon]